MSDLTKELKQLRELEVELNTAHREEQRFNLESFGAHNFDPEKDTLHSRAAEALRRTTLVVRMIKFLDSEVTVGGKTYGNTVDVEALKEAVAHLLAHDGQLITDEGRA